MKTKFSVKSNDKELKLAVLHPTDQVLTEANAVQNKVFKEAISSGALLGVTIDKVMREQGLWDDAKQKKVEELAKKINDARYQLARGGIKKSRGKELAISILDNINEQRRLLSERSIYASRTADGQADSVRFNYLVSACTVDDETGKKVFPTLADYEAASSGETALAAANCLAEVMYGIGTTSEAKNVEYKFLKRFGFVNDKLQLTNEDGKLIDRSGRLINEDGRYIDANGDFVDINGNRIDIDGNLLVEEMPFLDEDDNPIFDREDKVESPELATV